MSDLIPCEDCGHQISPRASSCPNCGCPTGVQTNSPGETSEKNTSKTGNSPEGGADEKNDASPESAPAVSDKQGAVGCFVIIFLVGLVWMFSGLGDSSDKNWREKDNSVGAYVMMQTFVKRRLRSPATADFASYNKSTITRIYGQKYQVRSYVDAQNGFGANVRTHFTGTIEKTSPDEWQLESLDL